MRQRKLSDPATDMTTNYKQYETRSLRFVKFGLSGR
jgi:hypothetical protein